VQRLNLKLSRFAGVSEAKADREPASEILSGAKTSLGELEARDQGFKNPSL